MSPTSALDWPSYLGNALHGQSHGTYHFMCCTAAVQEPGDYSYRLEQEKVSLQNHESSLEFHEKLNLTKDSSGNKKV
jgi:hypothetical protein